MLRNILATRIIKEDSVIQPSYTEIKTVSVAKGGSFKVNGSHFIACSSTDSVDIKNPANGKTKTYRNPFYVQLPWPTNSDDIGKYEASEQIFTHTCPDAECKCQIIKAMEAGYFRGKVEEIKITKAAQNIFTTKSEFTIEANYQATMDENSATTFENNVIIVNPDTLQVSVKSNTEEWPYFIADEPVMGNFNTSGKLIRVGANQDAMAEYINIQGREAQDEKQEIKQTLTIEGKKTATSSADESNDFLFPKDKIFYLNSGETQTQEEASENKEAKSADDLKPGLSAGAIAGIVIAVIVVVAIIAFLIYWFVCRKGSKSDKSSSSGKKQDDVDSGSGVNA